MYIILKKSHANEGKSKILNIVLFKKGEILFQKSAFFITLHIQRQQYIND